MNGFICPYCNHFSLKPEPLCSKCGGDLAHSATYLYSAGRFYDEANNAQEALKFYRYAARADSPLAMFRLGEMYENGIGTPINLNYAEYSHVQAAKHGHIPSLRWLCEAYRGLRDPSLKNTTKAKKYLQQLADFGDDDAIQLIEKINSFDDDDDDSLDEEIEDNVDNAALLAFGDKQELFSLQSIYGNAVEQTFPEHQKSEDTYEAVCAAEQAFLTSVIHDMEAWIEETEACLREKPDEPDYGSQASLEIFYQEKHYRESLKEELAIIRNNLEQPFFAHLFFTSDDGDIKDVHVGNELLVMHGQIYVISHNSKLGQVAHRREYLYADTEGKRYTLQWRRKIAIRDRQIIKVVEDFNSERGNETITYDDFLLTILAERKNEKQISDIVATIQENQNHIVIQPFDQRIILQGCAGSGKSMIMLQRLQYLLYNKRCKVEDISIFVPSDSFKEHLLPVRQKLGLQSVTVNTVGEYYLGVLKQYCKKSTKRFKTLTGVQILDDVLAPDIASYYYSDSFYNTAHSALQKQKDQYQDMMERYQDRLAIYRTKEKEWLRIREEAILTNNISPKKAKYCGNKPKKPSITLKSSVPELDRIFKLLDGSDEYLADRQTHIEKIDCPTGNRSGLMKCELYAAVLLHYIVHGKPNSTEKFLCIDEAQDLAPMEYQLLYSLNNESCIYNLYGDCHQTLKSSQGIHDWNEVTKKIGSFSQYSLNESYRNTWEITQFINMQTGSHITPMGLHGEEVSLVASVDELLPYLELFSANATAVIIRDSDVKKYGNGEFLPPEIASHVTVYTVTQCKGLEFHTVIVCDCEMDLTEKYISYSRARQQLFLYRPLSD